MSGMDHPPHFSDERLYPLQRHLGFVLTVGDIQAQSLLVLL